MVDVTIVDGGTITQALWAIDKNIEKWCEAAVAQGLLDYLLDKEYYAEQLIDNDNAIRLTVCELDRKNTVDIASLALAAAMYLLYEKYYEKYKEVLDWRDMITDEIKDYLETDIDHYIGVIMGQMSKVINDICAAPEVSINYAGNISRYAGISSNAASAGNALQRELNRKSCKPCDDCGDDIRGWSVMYALSAADDRVRFDERRVPGRLNMKASSLAAAHSGTFNLPNWDYQALGNAAGIAGSLASIYAGVVNSALGSFGYYSANFVNSLSG